MTRSGKVRSFRIFVAGLIPAAMYGCELGVLLAATLRKLNTDCVRAARHSLQALGWSMGSMTTLTTDEEVVLNLTQATPPQQLKRYLKQAFERLLDRRVWQKALDKKLVSGEAEGFNLLPLRRVLAAPAKKTEMWVRRKVLAMLWQVLPTAEWLNQNG